MNFHANLMGLKDKSLMLSIFSILRFSKATELYAPALFFKTFFPFCSPLLSWIIKRGKIVYLMGLMAQTARPTPGAAPFGRRFHEFAEN
jgi:hypothetical protein